MQGASVMDALCFAVEEAPKGALRINEGFGRFLVHDLDHAFHAVPRAISANHALFAHAHDVPDAQIVLCARLEQLRRVIE